MSNTTASQRYTASPAAALMSPPATWAAVPDIESVSRPLFGAGVTAPPTPSHRARDFGRRILNVTVALVGLILFAVPMFVIALAIRLTSPGPAIYHQPRVGLDRRGGTAWTAERGRRLSERRSLGALPEENRRGSDRRASSDESRREGDRGGRIFTMYKFRTMRPTAPDAKQVWSSEDDPRVTPIGRLLRATRLDELPQFFNVLKGDMNIVGPRPEQPTIFAELREEVTNYRERQQVLPGITGLAQVRLGYDATVDGVQQKVDLDLEYIRNRSAAEDLMIMAKTMPVMVFRKVWM